MRAFDATSAGGYRRLVQRGAGRHVLGRLSGEKVGVCWSLVSRDISGLIGGSLRRECRLVEARQGGQGLAAVVEIVGPTWSLRAFNDHPRLVYGVALATTVSDWPGVRVSLVTDLNFETRLRDILRDDLVDLIWLSNEVPVGRVGAHVEWWIRRSV